MYFREVSQFSLTLSLGQFFTEMCDTRYYRIINRWPSDKVRENSETNLKVHRVMQLSLSYKIFRCGTYKLKNFEREALAP